MRLFLLLFLTAILLGCSSKPPESPVGTADVPLTKEGRKVLKERVLAGILPPEEDIAEAPPETNQAQPPATLIPPAIRGYRTIALLAPFSGADKAMGESLLNAAMLAMFDKPQVRVNLLSPDAEGNIEQAFQQAQQAGAEAIIGPVRADDVKAISRAVQKYGVPLFSLSNSLSVGGGVIYPTGFAPEGQVPLAMNYLQEQGKYRLAVLAPDNQYGRLIEQQAQIYNTKNNRRFSITRLLYPTTIRDFSPFILQLQRLRVNAILLAPVKSQNLRIMAAQLDGAYLAAPIVQIVGLQLWDNFGNLQKEPSLDSAVWVSGKNPNATGFQQKYQRSFGKAPHPLAGMTYDIMSMLIELNDTQGFSKRSFANNTKTFGSTASISPRADGTILHRYYLKQIKGGKVYFLR